MNALSEPRVKEMLSAIFCFVLQMLRNENQLFLFLLRVEGSSGGIRDLFSGVSVNINDFIGVNMKFARNSIKGAFFLNINCYWEISIKFSQLEI